MSEMKTTLDWINSRLKTIKEKKINNFEDVNFRNYPKWNETQREKN